MVLFLLYLQAELENVSSISLQQHENLCINCANPLSNDQIREKVVIPAGLSQDDDDENSKEPPSHLRLSWEKKGKRATLTKLTSEQVKTALKKKKKNKNDDYIPRDYTADDSGEWVPLLAVECRGLEPTAFFSMGGEFAVTSAGGTEFSAQDVDLSEGDWADYDAENDEAVSISDIKFKWEAI